jgi:hypothetical protein
VHVIAEAEVGQILGENVVAVPSSSDNSCTYAGGDSVFLILTGLSNDPAGQAAAFTRQSDMDIAGLGDDAFSRYDAANPDAVSVYIRKGATELEVYVHRANGQASNLALGKQIAQIVLGRLP